MKFEPIHLVKTFYMLFFCFLLAPLLGACLFTTLFLFTL